MVVTCMMTLVTRVGPENQKGVITGIFRSLGALARACGPAVASIGKNISTLQIMKVELRHVFHILLIAKFENILNSFNP